MTKPIHIDEARETLRDMNAEDAFRTVEGFVTALRMEHSDNVKVTVWRHTENAADGAIRHRNLGDTEQERYYEGKLHAYAYVLHLLDGSDVTSTVARAVERAESLNKA